MSSHTPAIIPARRNGSNERRNRAAQEIARTICHALSCYRVVYDVQTVTLGFIQLSAFAANWVRMRLTGEDLRRLECEIEKAPDAPPVMRASGGLRKIRF